ncbi:MAG: polysulfide reductase NrfD, partial [Chloroflexi bacterium]|nr:polysulfide reductase NrfD [Chloroflexota bacterium]
MQLALKPRLQPYTAWLALLLTLMAVGAAAGLVVFARGLAVTNLSDYVPWGLWITMDISAIALSAGAFAFCAAAYLLGLKELRPLARTAAFVGLTGYSMAMLCLLLDIGRPDRFWHGFVFWNVHSVLWEVTMCVGLYFSVLLLENAATLADLPWLRRRYPRLAERMYHVHHYTPYLAVAGLFFSLLHQSSLGATYAVIAARPIWFRPGLAVLFILSAVAGGMALTLLVTLAVKWLRPQTAVKPALLDGVGRVLGWMMLGYLYLRFWDAFAMTYTYTPGRSEALRLLTKGPLAFNFWFGEMLVGALIPAAILIVERWRRDPRLLAAALAMVVGGVVAYRWDTNLLGQMVVIQPFGAEGGLLYAAYTPALVEWLTAAGVLAFGLLLLTLG